MSRLVCALVLVLAVAALVGRGAAPHRAAATSNLVLNGTFDSNAADWDIDTADIDSSWTATPGNPGGSMRVQFVQFGATSGDLVQCLSGIEPGMLVTISGDVLVPNDDPQPNGTEAALGIGFYPDDACSASEISSDETRRARPSRLGRALRGRRSAIRSSRLRARRRRW